jgi:hypothetical protein
MYPSTSRDDGNRSSFRNVLYSSLLNCGRWTKSRNPVIPNVRFALTCSSPTFACCGQICLQDRVNKRHRQCLYITEQQGYLTSVCWSTEFSLPDGLPRFDSRQRQTFLSSIESSPGLEPTQSPCQQAQEACSWE